MRSKRADWFETKLQYDKVQENGSQKKVTELYVVDALSFTEAESAITEEMKPYISGDYKIKTITPPTTTRCSSPTARRTISGTRLSWLLSRLMRGQRKRSAASSTISCRPAPPTPHSKPSTTS